MSRAIVCVWLQRLDLLVMLLLVWQRQPPTVAAAGVHGSELGTAAVSPSGLIGALIGGQLDTRSAASGVPCMLCIQWRAWSHASSLGMRFCLAL